MPRKSKPGSAYPADWKAIAVLVKKAAGWCCVRCGMPHQKGHVLTVHHLDLDPGNCEWYNLAALCQQCHLSIQGKVILERPWMFEHTAWFKPYVAGYNASQRGLPTDKQYVMDHLEELLSLPWLAFDLFATSKESDNANPIHAR